MIAAVAPQRPKSPLESPLAMIGVVGQVGYMIAVPAFAFGFGGAYMDKWLGTSPLFVLLGLTLALTVSSIAVYRLTKRLLSPTH